MDESRARHMAPLYRLCFAAGAYGVGFGILMLPAGLFVGPHILGAAVAHIGLGVGFLTAASGLRRRRPWAAWTALLLGSFVATIALIAVVESVNESDSPSAISWGVCSVIFATLAAWSFRFLLSSDHRRFSLRTLMIASTMLALLCAAAVMIARTMQYGG